MNRRSISRKFFSFITSLLLVFNTLGPLAYAQEATSTAEPTISPSSEPSPSPTPSETPTPTPIESGPTATPEVSPSPSPTAEGQLTAVVLSDTSASSVTSLDLDPVDVTSSASLITDKADYAPTDTVVISGTGLKVNTTYTLVITSDGPPALEFSTQVTTNEKGEFVYAYQLDGTYRPNYEVELKDSSGNIVATTTFTDANPSARLDQCANDPAPSPSTDGCSASASDWVNGNLGASKSSYFEGDSIPYRLTFDNLSLASHTVTIEWDTTKSSKHAIDYLTTFNQTVATANPCLGVSGCGSLNTDPIPADPQVTGAGVTPIAGNFTLYGGTITAVSPYSYADGTGFTGDKSARITITFTASVANPVLAWGGHISTRADWGLDNSAVNISGSPYHTRLIDLDGSGGNQDRSLSAAAVIFPGSITIIKDATPNGSTSFLFTASPSPLTNFSLVDDGTSANTRVFSNIVDFQTYSVNETPVPTGWGFDSASCSVTSPNGGTQSVSGSTATINLKEGENVTCTFINTLQQGNLVIVKNTTGGDMTFNYSVTGPTPLTPSITTSGGTGSSGPTPVNSGTNYAITETVPSGWNFGSASCDKAFTAGTNGVTGVTVVAGQTTTCTFTNTKKPKLTVVKVTDPTNDTGKFNLSINGTQYVTDVSNGGTTNAQFANIGSNTFAEAAGTGTNLSDYTSVVSGVGCGGTATAGTITLAAGDDKTCTITNTRKGHITIEKQTIPDGDPAEFIFTGNVAGTLGDGDTATEEVVPGVYSSTEAVLSGWALTNITCNDGDSTGDIKTGIATFNIAAGEDVTCTFTNNKPAAQIDLTPLTDANKIGDDHVISANVQVQNGDGVWGPAADGTTITFSITNSNGATAVFVPASPNTCTTTGGACSITINSPTPGHVVVNASASPTVLGVTLNVSTGTGGDNSADAQKDYVNARISITPNTSTNEVGNSHDFIVTVEQNTGSGFVPVPEGTLANAIVSPSTSLDVSDCNDGVNASGQCTVTINSSVAGVFTITARSTVVVNGVEFKLQTNGVGDNSGPATKTYVDANIALSPLTAENNVNAPHTVTVTVTKDPGTGATPAAGEHVDFTLADSGGAVSVLDNTASTCDDAGPNTDVSGQCIIVFTSASPGTVTIHATVTLNVGGVSLARATDGTHGSSEDATKTFVAGKIIVVKQTLPDGSSQSFTFTPSYNSGATFNLIDGQQNDSGFLALGTYSVSEGAVTDWDSDGGVCNGEGNTPASITLHNGDVVTCTFTNTKQGKVTIVKDATPNDAQDFEFSFTGKDNFFLDDDAGVQDPTGTNYPQAKTFENLSANAVYTAGETLPAFWQFQGINCINDSDRSPYTNIVVNGTSVIISLDPAAEVTCTFNNFKPGPTRTQGFWQTHTSFTSTVFATHFSGGMLIGTAPHKGSITNFQVPKQSQLFGAYYSNISMKSTGKGKLAQRGEVDKARMVLLQQLVTAKLNCVAFGCSSTVQSNITAADIAYNLENINGMQLYTGLLDVYNNSGDTIIISPPLPVPGKATPKTSQSFADITFWDAP
ncbi:hypothetical protein HY387_00480 [Candidatus Daviesbacteria bacterium]|nr:hypothetical protein [Candidatus Daviesbacteria bacterium]